MNSQVQITIHDPVYSSVKDGKKLIAPAVQYTYSFWKQGQYKKIKRQAKSTMIGKNGTMYTGLIPRIREYCDKRNMPIEVTRSELMEQIESEVQPNSDFRLSGITLRPDQERMVKTALREKRGILVAPMGTGKTILMLSILKAFEGKASLILVPNLSILEQTKDEIERFGFKSVSILGGNREKKLYGRIVLSTIQTFVTLDLPEIGTLFDLMMVDECFHKNTLVSTSRGVIPICKIQNGDIVHNNNQYGRVTKIYKNNINLDEICKITLSNKTEIICSRSHLIFSHDRGWIKACMLIPGVDTLHAKENNDTRRKTMHGLPQNFSNEQLYTTILQPKMRQQFRTTQTLAGRTQKKMDKGKSRTLSASLFKCFNKNETEQPYKEQEDTRKNQTIKNRKWNQQIFDDLSRWKWQIHPSTTKKTSRTIGKFRVRVSSKNRRKKSRISNMLQNRHCQPTTKNWYRSRWHQPSHKISCNQGHEKATFSGTIRVENIKVYKPGNNDKYFSGYISDQERNQGFVTFYDLSVDSHPSYYANGILVHNCHLSSQAEATLEQICQHVMAPYRFGFTATPPKEMQRRLTVEGIVGPIIDETTWAEGQKENLLTEPYLKLVSVPKCPSLDNYRSYQDIYRVGIVEYTTRNRLVVREALALANNGLTSLIFVRELDHGQRIYDIAQKTGLNCVYLKGDVDSIERNKWKKKLEEREIDSIICTSIFREGINIKSLNAVVLAAGGKSEIALLQTIGRALRRNPGKDEAVIVEFLDIGPFLSSHVCERLQVFNELGIL